MYLFYKTKNYKELCEVLVGEDATSRYTFKEIIAYAYTLKNIEERYNAEKK